MRALPDDFLTAALEMDDDSSLEPSSDEERSGDQQNRLYSTPNVQSRRQRRHLLPTLMQTTAQKDPLTSDINTWKTLTPRNSRKKSSRTPATVPKKSSNSFYGRKGVLISTATSYSAANNSNRQSTNVRGRSTSRRGSAVVGDCEEGSSVIGCAEDQRSSTDESNSDLEQNFYGAEGHSSGHDRSGGLSSVLQSTGDQESGDEELAPAHGSTGMHSSCDSTGDKDEVPESVSDLLKCWIKEVKTSNNNWHTKVSELEKKIDELQESPKVSSKLKPPQEVRNVVHKIYQSLLDNDETGWNLDEPFKSTSNKEVVKNLIRDVKPHVSNTSSAIIKAAAKTYFLSLSGTERLKKSGKYTEKCFKQRRRNRLLRKMNTRKAALLKTTSISEKDKPKLMSSFIPELMSSEESDEDGTYTVRPLSWRSEKATELFCRLDVKADKKKSKRSKRMTCERLQGPPSDREKPNGSVPSWCVKS